MNVIFERPYVMAEKEEKRVFSFSLKQKMWKNYHAQINAGTERTHGLTDIEEIDAILEKIQNLTNAHKSWFPDYLDYDREMYETCLAQSHDFVAAFKDVRINQDDLTQKARYLDAKNNLLVVTIMTCSSNQYNALGKCFLILAALHCLLNLIFFQGSLFIAGTQLLTSIALFLPFSLVGVALLSSQAIMLPGAGALLVLSIGLGLGALWHNPSPQGSEKLARLMKELVDVCDSKLPLESRTESLESRIENRI